MEKCIKLESALIGSDGDSDIDGKELFKELVALRAVVELESIRVQILEHILQNHNYAPNTSVSLRILLTLSVTSDSREPNFPKVRFDI